MKCVSQKSKKCRQPKRTLTRTPKAVKYPGIVQGSEFEVSGPQREDGQLAFPMIAPKADVKRGLPSRVWNDRLKVFVTRGAFAIKLPPVRPTPEQRVALKTPGAEIDRSWRRRQKRILRTPDTDASQCPVEFSGRNYFRRKSKRRVECLVASRDASYGRFFRAVVKDGSVKAYKPEPGRSFWSDTEPGRERSEAVRKAMARAFARKQAKAGKFRKRLGQDEVAIRDLYNRLNDWETRLGIAWDELKANPCRETRAAYSLALMLPATYPTLMRAAAVDRSVETLVYGIIGFYDEWTSITDRPTRAPGAKYVSYPILHRGKGELIRQWEQVRWTVIIDGEEHVHQERGRWCSAEGQDMTDTDWDAAREGGYYRLRRGRVGKRLRERMDDLGWSKVYDTHDGKPVRQLVPHVPGQTRRALIPLYGRLVAYSYKFPGTDKFIPAAIETSGEVDLIRIPYGKARGEAVTAFTTADGTECATRGRHAPIVQYRTSKLAFARRDLAIRDERTHLMNAEGDKVPVNHSGPNRRIVGTYYAYSVQQRKERAVRKGKRDVAHAVSIIRHVVGDKQAAALIKQLGSAEKIIEVAKKVVESKIIA